MSPWKFLFSPAIQENSVPLKIRDLLIWLCIYSHSFKLFMEYLSCARQALLGFLIPKMSGLILCLFCFDSNWVHKSAWKFTFILKHTNSDYNLSVHTAPLNTFSYVKSLAKSRSYPSLDIYEKHISPSLSNTTM